MLMLSSIHVHWQAADDDERVTKMDYFEMQNLDVRRE